MMRLALGFGDEQSTTPIFREYAQDSGGPGGTAQSNPNLTTPFVGTPTVPPSASTPVSGDMVIQALIGGQGSLSNRNAGNVNPGNNNGRVFNQQIQMPSYGVQQGWQSLLPGLMSVNHPANNPLVQANMFDQRRTPMEGRWGTGASMFSPWRY